MESQVFYVVVCVLALAFRRVSAATTITMTTNVTRGVGSYQPDKFTIVGPSIQCSVESKDKWCGKRNAIFPGGCECQCQHSKNLTFLAERQTCIEKVEKDDMNLLGSEYLFGLFTQNHMTIYFALNFHMNPHDSNHWSEAVTE